MSIAKDHAEWLSLLDISGPFLSMPVLMRAFPQGLDAHDADLARRLRLAHAEWRESQQHTKPDLALHRRWVEFVLSDVLGFGADKLAEGQRLPPSLQISIPEHGETLRPDVAIIAATPAPATVADVAAQNDQARLLIQIYPSAQPLDRALPDRRWAAKPDARMMELLRATDVRLGLVTNGEQWMLVDAPRGGTTANVSWYASLWLDEPLTLRAFCSLLKSASFFGVAESDTPEALLAESAQNQQEVTDRLGNQVRRAVELLVQAIDRADQDRKGDLLTGVREAELYEAALTVMMRLVFLFSAEERGLLLLGDPLYDQNYAVSTLGAQLREAADQFGEEVMEHRFDAWCRLVAAFRTVHGGVQHDRMALPAYGSSLFDPDRFPFLEGRAGKRTPLHEAHPLPINNRVTLHLLDALQWLKTSPTGAGGRGNSSLGGSGEPRRLSFRGLDIEQIGHVYEGLLDHGAQRARKPMLGLTGASGKEPELALSALEARRAQGEDALVTYLKVETGRSESALRRAFTPLPDREGVGSRLSALRAACNNDESLLARVLPFANLIRDDDFGQPVVINTGSAYVTQATTRRSTGTHYTPRSLTEPIVQHTLEPLAYIGPAEGLPKEQWRLRSPSELLQLKVCDMAMGSGAFLVQACRYLAERLVEAWDVLSPSPLGGEGRGEGGRRITPDGSPASGKPGEQLIPQDAEERLVFARRIVADRCLYGVDKNPMAVEMAKLSLWLITLDKGRPFTFLDHALKCGDSLVGADEDMFRRWATSTRDAGTRMLNAEELDTLLDTAREKRRELESFDVREPRDAERKAALLREADDALEKVKLGCNLLIGVKLLGLKRKDAEARNAALVDEFVRTEAQDLREMNHISNEAVDALEAAWKVRAFHWPFEFPEVFFPALGVDGLGERSGGFSAFIGNPPFLGGKRISGELGKRYLDYLSAAWSHAKGHADLCVYFFLRTFGHLRPGGTFGLLATNTIAQGDTRERGLDFIVGNGGAIYNAAPSMPWPSDAAVFVSVVHVARGGYAGVRQLDGRSVTRITSLLDSAETQSLGKPLRLAVNEGKSFQGSIVLGMGFVLTPDEAQRLLDQDPRNRDVLFPYLNGEDLNSRPDTSPSRWVINFFDWPLDRSAEGSWKYSDEDRQKGWLRAGRVPHDYLRPVAADYPDCLAIVERLVKPERTRLKPNGEFALRKPLPQRWWIYADKRPELYATIAPMKRVLALPIVSKFVSFVYVQATSVFAHRLELLTFEFAESFAILQSNIHEPWARTYSSTLETRLNYSATDCFETFPFPQSPNAYLQSLDIIGETYHEHRRQIMLARWEGLTKTYNRFHDPKEASEDIARLRALHVEMDHAVAAAYGWNDLDLGHGFRETAQGVRYTISEPARRQVLARLLRLNHERWEKEQEAKSQEARTKNQDPSTKKARKARTVKETKAQYQLSLGETDG